MIKVGDVVFWEDKNLYGRCVCFDKKSEHVGIDFGNKFDGHMLSGNIETNTGWWVENKSLKKINKFGMGYEVLCDNYPEWIGIIKYIRLDANHNIIYFIDFQDDTFKGHNGDAAFGKAIISKMTGMWIYETNIKRFKR